MSTLFRAMKTKALLVSLLAASAANASLIITGYVDGTQSGGNPKAMELYALAPIADLSNYWLIRDSNGTAGGPFTESDEFQLPAISLSAGSFFYLYGTSDTETYMEGIPFGDTDSGTAVLDSILNANGDDIFALSTSGDVADAIDAFGLLGQGDTDFAADSIAYRPDNSLLNPTGVQDAGNFTITGYTDLAFTGTFGTYVPEPSAIGGLFGIAALLVARRRA